MMKNIFSCTIFLLCFSLGCSKSPMVEISLDDPEIDRLYVSKDFMFREYLDTIYRVNDQFLYSPGKVDGDIYFIVSQNIYGNPDKYLAQFLFAEDKDIHIQMLPDKKYELDHAINQTFKSLYENTNSLSHDDDLKDKAIQENQKNAIAAFILYVWKKTGDLEEQKFVEYLKVIDPVVMKETYYGRALREVQDQVQRETYPQNISMSGVDDQKYQLSDFKGKITFIDNWASWCGPCIKEMPNIIELYNRLEKKEEIRFVAISNDESKEAWIRMGKVMNIPFQSLLLSASSRKPYAGYYGISSIPYGILLDESGKILASGIRNSENLEEELGKLGVR
ncbi:MAG: TlpA family protein disulfide reductase [Saprospiraceae bacterium]|nr:TlpA family protein disulfide reductase [Saprospiraceae bacterium]